MRPLLDIARDLAEGRTTSRALAEEALARIGDPEGEGATTFIRAYRKSALATADTSDQMRAAGVALPPLAGIPVAIKDLFNVAGEVTLAGSKALEGSNPASADATIVARLRAAGAVIVGRTNMVEFAYSGVGLNPHYGTPRNPYDRETGRIPGGSSSGAAVSVSDGMAAAAVGTDTAGSVRIPAALCGLTGFKPTARRVPLDGTLPLAPSLDSTGPLAPRVACCALVDAVLAGEPADALEPLPVAGLKLGVPQSYVLDDLEDAVAGAFERALSALSAAGAQVIESPFEELLEIPEINAKGGLAAAQAYAWHSPLLARAGNLYDPRVRVRIERGATISARDYLQILNRRTLLQQKMNRITTAFDAVAMPSVARVAPPIAEVDRDEESYHSINMLMLRNTGLVNFLDRCAVTLPCHEPGAGPVGLMLMGETMGDHRLLAIAAGVEDVLAGARG